MLKILELMAYVMEQSNGMDTDTKEAGDGE